MQLRVLGLAILLLSAGIAHSSPDVQRCSLTTIDAPNAAGGTFVFGITDAGLVSGSWYDNQGTSHGALWSDGHFESIDYPGQGPYGLSLYAANDKGRIAGGYYDTAGVSHTVIYNMRKRTFALLPDFPGSAYNAAGSIDNRGRVSGNYTLDPAGSTQLVAWFFDGAYDYYVARNSDQSLLGTISYGMNNDATIVGFYLDATGMLHGYTRPVGRPPVPFDIPGSTRTRLLGINDEGILTGDYSPAGVRHGLVYFPGRNGRSGKAVSIDFPGAKVTVVAAVNNSGDIAGYYADAQGVSHGYVGYDCLDD